MSGNWGNLAGNAFYDFVVPALEGWGLGGSEEKQDRAGMAAEKRRLSTVNGSGPPNPGDDSAPDNWLDFILGKQAHADARRPSWLGPAIIIGAVVLGVWLWRRA